MSTSLQPADTPSQGLAAPEPRTGESTAELGPILTEPPDPYIGTVLGERYKVMQKLGAGGMGAVYLAEHVLIERKVAIKILSQDFATKADLVQRFIQEARAAAKIGHENIVEVYDFGETASGSVFFAMEYLAGIDLANLIQKCGALQAARARPIALQICRALASAHNKQIIHRDLKPENIFLIEKEGRTDFVKILDFGIAKMSNMEAGGNRLTQAGMIFGTPEYMSPEQARGEAPDHRVDIYALGCILYEMLTGKVPFSAETFMGTLTKHMFEMPEFPSRRARFSIPQDLEAICLRAIDKDRDRRFQTMQEFAQALEGELHVPMPPMMVPMPPMMSDPSMAMHANQMAAMSPIPPMQNMAPGMMGAPMPYSQMPYPQGVILQSGLYQSSGQVVAPMAGQVPGSGISMGGMASPNNVSGVFVGPGGASGPNPGPHMAAMGIPAMAGYSITAPPTSYEVSRRPNAAQWRRMVFALVGATIGVLVLSVLMLWPSSPTSISVRPAHLPLAALTPPKPLPAPPAPLGPAHLVIKGQPDSRVLLDFKDIGYIQPNGELAYEAPSPGTSEWSIHVKVIKDGRGEFTTRLMLQAGSTKAVLAEQPLLSPAKRHRR